MEPQESGTFDQDPGSEDEDDSGNDIQQCENCSCRELRHLVACENKKCAQRDLLYCKCCLQCREPFPCGNPDHFSCWNKHLPVSKKRMLTHVQRPARDYRRVDELFRAETEHSEQVKRHEKDKIARWFIVTEPRITYEMDDYGRPIATRSNSYGTLARTNRFESLCNEVSDPKHPDAEQFPCLVSFIGKTGVGKSTLIRGLITLSEKVENHDIQTLEAPVTRINNLEHATKPTSAGVNLYKDLTTSGDLNPIFFADCEGFGAGVASAGAGDAVGSSHSDEIPITSSLYSDSDTSDSQDSRSEAVSTLYARFLYAFSDVVCFVSSDMQSFAAEIERLLLFIAKGFEATVNQTPAKTLIYIFNQTSEYFPEMLNPETLKSRVLSNMRDVWINSKSLAKIKETKWADQINSTEEFLGKYFQEIHFCYIPRKGTVPLEKIAGQYALLRHQITNASRFAVDKRKGSWAHYNAEDLSGLFELAFKHFATQSGPFDLAIAARKYDENPVNMEDHIMCLLRQVAMTDDSYLLYSDFPKIVASAFVNHCLPRGIGESITSPENLWLQVYEGKCSGITRFYTKYQHCQFKKGTAKCALLSDFHQEIHQDNKGKSIGLGVFDLGELKKTMDDIIQKVKDRFLEQYRKICQDIEGYVGNPRPTAPQVLTHRTGVLEALQSRWSQVHSYRTCFTCLRSLPDHVLPCEHALCETCVIDFGVPSEDSYETEIALNKCVLCRESWEPPQLVRIKPECAGVRILTLDGGGVRGILELALWQLVEKEIGLDLPIDRFFDLIIGTSTGGIIALGLVLCNLSSIKMVEKFKTIAQSTFAYVRGMKYVNAVTEKVWEKLVPPTGNLQKLAGAFCVAMLGFVEAGGGICVTAPLMLACLAVNMAKQGSIYPRDPIQKELQELFGTETSMFGTPKSTKLQRTTRVAVMAVKNGGKQATTLANYNRRHAGGSRADFERGDNERDEIKVWEAALCSSAAPPCFSAFLHEKSNTTYIDGGLLHNNPIFWAIEEYKKIWVPSGHGPEVSLDLLVSVGTGHFPTKEAKAENKTGSAFQAWFSALWSNVEKKTESSLWASFNALWSRLDSEEIWHKFQESVAYNQKIHHRLNVAIDWYCPLNQSRKILELLAALQDANESEDTDTTYVGAQLRNKVKEIAQLLVAKLFFFQPIRVVPAGPGTPAILEGKILCRLGKKEIALKNLIRRVSTFWKSDRGYVYGRAIPISAEVRAAVERDDGFEVHVSIEKSSLDTPVEIMVIVEQPGGIRTPRIPISGFPRKFDDLEWMNNLRSERYRYQ